VLTARLGLGQWSVPVTCAPRVRIRHPGLEGWTMLLTTATQIRRREWCEDVVAEPTMSPTTPTVTTAAIAHLWLDPALFVDRSGWTTAVGARFLAAEPTPPRALPRTVVGAAAIDHVGLATSEQGRSTSGWSWKPRRCSASSRCDTSTPIRSPPVSRRCIDGGAHRHRDRQCGNEPATRPQKSRSPSTSTPKPRSGVHHIALAILTIVTAVGAMRGLCPGSCICRRLLRGRQGAGNRLRPAVG